LFEILKVLHNWSGEWLGLDLKTYLENDTCYKETRLHSQNPSTMLDTIVDIIGKDPIWSFDNLDTHFNNEQDLHMSLINYEESGYGRNLFFWTNDLTTSN
jgi:hypothetical protein